MDDSMDSVKDEKTGIELYRQLSGLWLKAGMYARKWLSNSKIVLEQVKKEDRAFETDLSKGELPAVKTLGVLWQAECDQFTFRISAPNLSEKFTKRNFLRKIATIYDPLGFLAPYTVRGKILMQEAWLSGSEWDELLPDELDEKVHTWFTEMKDLAKIQVSRCMFFNTNEDSEIQVFVDASTKAYGAVAYVRHTDANVSVSTHFIAAKSRVAPLTSVSVPRLELMAAVLGLNLAQSVCCALGAKITSTVFWSDSMNVLWWIRGQSRQYKTFVANRVGPIHSATNPEQWKYIPSAQNPADLVSRGLTVEELSTNVLWWKGPEVLQQPSESSSPSTIEPDEEAKVEVKRKSLKTDFEFFVKVEGTDKQDNRLEPERYSSWTRLVRVYVWVSRFIDNCQVVSTERRKSALSSKEFRNAEEKLIKQTQFDCFPDEYRSLMKGREISCNSKILALNPKLDEDGVMRSDSRLKFHEFLPYSVRCPIILPKNSWVTKLIIRHYHEKNKHCGTNQTLSALSTRFWIMSAREEIRKVEKECTECRRRRTKSAEQIMGPVPEFRLGKSMQAFNETAIDFAEPFFTKQGRGKTRKKRYLCVFTCMSCRAVHLEIAYGLDTDSFFNTFYRFVSRRGLPSIVVTDNGTNFVGAVNELKELYSQIDKDRIQNKVTIQGIQWYFNPPMAPHFGGVHESMVKSAKRAIYKVLGNADVNEEELTTAFVGVEGLINSRPLTYQTSHPDDDCVLTPNHFLHGPVGGQFAPEVIDTTSFDIRKRWRRVQELIAHFWKRWMLEYLPMLGSRKTWKNIKRDFCVGDIVTLIEPESTSGQSVGLFEYFPVKMVMFV